MNEGQVPFVPEPAESFEIDYLNTEKARKVIDLMTQLGFTFRSSSSDENGQVRFEGEHSDGSTISVVVEKGEGYRSPKEIADANANVNS